MIFDQVRNAYARAMGLHEEIILRRGTDASTDVTVKGRVYDLTDDQLLGESQQMIRKAVIMAQDTDGFDITGIVNNKDRIVWSDRVSVIISSNTHNRRVEGRTVAIELELAGA